MGREENLTKNFKVRSYLSLPEMKLGWISLRDHFIATVGPHSGQGEPLKNLLVIADAKIQPQSRFPDHPHQDMEILTWVVEGTLQHLDNKGTNQAVKAGSIQLMSARDGIFHAEGNTSHEPLRLLQIWIRPEFKGGTPVVEQAALGGEGFQLMAGPENSPLNIRQQLWLYAAKLDGAPQSFQVPPGKFAYGVSIGSLTWNGRTLQDGDAVSFEEGAVQVAGHGQAILILQNQN